jgi:gamma-glutamylcysteine synthetase
VNLDFSSEEDMVQKFRIGLALQVCRALWLVLAHRMLTRGLSQPIATALFANSPFVDGKPCGYKSYRSHVWCAAGRHLECDMFGQRPDANHPQDGCGQGPDRRPAVCLRAGLWL